VDIAGDPRELFYHDVPPELQNKAISLLQNASNSVRMEAIVNEPWLQIPSTYIICEDDKGLPAAAQEAMCSVKGKWTVERISGSHSPFLAQPDKLFELFVKYVDSPVS
jgi:hypothetical protein